MSNKLYNILVPVDFTSKNRWAITKAIELSNSFNCNIHLVYVAGKRRSLMRQYSAETAFRRLEQMRDAYSQQLCGEGVSMYYTESYRRFLSVVWPTKHIYRYWP
jgi:hypothetical protein